MVGRRWSQELLHLLPPFTGKITAKHETATEFYTDNYLKKKLHFETTLLMVIKG